MPVPLTTTQLFANNAISLLAAPITNTATSLTVITGQGALYPQPTGDGSDYFLITLEDQAATIREIIKVTTRSSDTLGFLLADRGLEGTSARAWTSAAGSETIVDHRITAETLDRLQLLPDSGGELIAENPSSPISPIASGANSVAIGSGSQAAVADSLAIGSKSLSRISGITLANGQFSGAGDAQTGKYLVRNITTNSTSTELFVDGAAGTKRLNVTANSTWLWEATIVGHRTDSTGGHAGYKLSGVIYRASATNSVALLGLPSKQVLAESNAAWDVAVSADTTNGSLKFSVTGETSKTIRWFAVVDTTEVTN
jgi:hypothetical protein